MKTMKNYALRGLLGLSLALGTSSCKKDDNTVNNPPAEEGETITTVNLHFMNAADSSVSTFTFSDPDGPGGNLPVQFDTIRLSTNSSYYMAIELLDESKNPAEDITEEIEEEDEEHQFFFTSTTPNFGIAYLDMDANGNPVGLLNAVSTFNATSPGHPFQVGLQHQPGVKAPAPGDPNAGDTDIDLTFSLEIQ